MNRNFSLCNLFVGLLLFISSQACAQEINVPDDVESIQGAIQEAQDGDVIIVAPGEYIENIDFLGKAITLTSHIHFEDDRQFIEQTIIDGGQNDCVIAFNNEEDRRSVLRGFTIRNGIQNFGGGIDCQRSAAPQLLDLLITENTAEHYGGGIYLSTGAHPLIRRTTIINNEARLGAGIGSGRPCECEIEDVRIIGNAATNGYGAIYCEAAGRLSLNRVLIVGNENATVGLREGSDSFFRNVTIADNISETNTGIFVSNSELELVNCIIRGGGESLIAAGADGEVMPLNVSYCNIVGGQERIVIRDNIEFNMDDESCFYGDPRFVNANEGDFNLLPNSPCIDAGDPELDEDPDGTRSDIGAFFFDQRELGDDPDIIVEPMDALALNPLNFNEYFDEVYALEEYALPISISNIGRENLVIERIEFDEDVFRVEVDQFELELRESLQLDIIFAPDGANVFDSEMRIISNDPDEGEFTIELVAEAENPPVLEVIPEEINQDLLSGREAEVEIEVHNDGQAEMHWSGSLIPVRDPEWNGEAQQAGEILENIETPFRRITSITFDGELVWGSVQSNNDSWVFAMDPETEEFVTHYLVHVYIYNMMWDGSNLWITGSMNGENGCWIMSREGEILDEIFLPVERIFDVAHCPDGIIFAHCYDNRSIYVYDTNNDELLAIIPQNSIQNLPEDISLGSLEYVRVHSSAPLWSAYRDRMGQCHAVQMRIGLDWSLEIVQDFEVDIYNYTNLMHDGSNLWSTGNEDDNHYQIFDDGVHETPWITCDRYEDILGEQESTLLNISFNASYLIEGRYEAVYRITSNDPENPDAEVPISLNVEATPCFVLLSPSEIENGVNFNEHFDDLWAGGEYRIPFTFVNTGSEDLVLDDFDSNNDFFAFEEDELVVNPGDRNVVDLIFNPDEEGAQEGVISLQTNDPDFEEIIFNVAGEVITGPDINVDQVEFDIDINANETDEIEFTITNAGELPLVWNSNKDILQQPAQDLPVNQRSARSISGQEPHRIIPERDIPGDRVRTHRFPHVSGFEIASDGDRIFGIDRSGFFVWSVDIATGEFNRLFDYEPYDRNSTSGVVFDGETIWLNDYIPGNALMRIRRFTIEGELVETFDLPLEQYCRITHDHNGHFYTAGRRDIQVWSSEDHEMLAEIRFDRIENNRLDDYSVWGLTWTSEGENGQLWATMENNNVDPVDYALVKFRFSNNWILRLDEIVPLNPDDQLAGLVYDGENGWGMTTDYLYSYLVEFDDGMDQPSWIRLEPHDGEIAPGQQIDAAIVFDPEELIDGHYEVVINLTSNDPDEPVIELAATMNVHGNPEIELEWDDEINPDRIYWNQMVDNVFVGYEYNVPLIIRNTGEGELLINEIDIENDVFDINLEQIHVEPHQETVIELLFAPDEEGLSEGNLLLIPEDHEIEEIEIELRARAFNPPVIEIDHEEFVQDILRGDHANRRLRISNNGEYRLDWYIEIEEPEEQVYEPGETIREIQTPAQSTEGLTWDGEYIWGIGDGVYTIDPLTGEYQERFDDMGGDNIAFDGENLLIIGQVGARNKIIRVVDREGNILDQWEHRSDIRSIAADLNGHLLVYHRMEARIVVVDIETHQTVEGFDPGHMFEWGVNRMQWVPEHEDGHLWFMAEGHACQVGFDNSWNPHPVSAVEIDNHNGTGPLTHNGENLWFCLAQQREPDFFRVAHDGIDEIPWITLDRMAGEIGVNRVQTTTITFNTQNIHEAGDLSATLHLHSNDPATPLIDIPVELEVLPNPQLEADPIPSPLRDAEDIRFPNVVLGDPVDTLSFSLTNIGIDDLEITEVILENVDDFSTDLEEQIIEREQELVFNVMFHPTQVGRCDGELHISTNATNFIEGDEMGHIWYDLYSWGIHPAQIELNVDPEEPIELIINPEDDPVDRILTISNTAPRGAANLDVLLSNRVPVPDEDRDNQHSRSARLISNTPPYRDDPGDIIAEYDTELRMIDGMTWDGRYVWAVLYSEHALYAFNPVNGQFVHTIEIENPVGVAYDGSHIWTYSTADQRIHIFNTDGDEVDSFASPVGIIMALTSDQRRYMYINGGENIVYVMSLESRDLITSFILPVIDNDNRIYHLEWVEAHPDGQLWGTGYSTAYQYQVDKLNGEHRLDWSAEIVNSVQWEANQYARAITHDEENLWRAIGNDPFWYVFDDGITEQHPASWLTIDPDQTEIRADDSEDITLTINPGNLEDGLNLCEIVIETNDPEHPETIIALQITSEFELRHFNNFLETDLHHIVQVEMMVFNEAQVPTGHEIGVFTEDDVLAGAVIWDLRDEAVFITAYGDDPETDEVEGFTEGESISFRVWDDFTGIEWERVDAHWFNGEGVWENGGESVVQLSGANWREQRVHLRSGWNMMSLNIDPVDYYWGDEGRGPNVVNLFEQLEAEEEHNIILLKSEDGLFWAPAWAFVNIPFYDLTEGYQVKMREGFDDDFVISGIPIAPDADIPIEEGWNLIPYYPLYELDMSPPEFYGLSPIIEHVTIAKDEYGRFLSHSFRFNNMPPWSPGEGYQILVDEDVVLNYPPPEDNVVLAHQQSSGQTRHWTLQTSSCDNLSLLVNLSETKRHEFAEIAAVNTSGQIVGSGTIDRNGRCGLAVWGDVPETEVIEGLKEGEPFRLITWNSEKEIEQELQASRILTGTGLIYTKNGLTVIDATPKPLVPQELTLESAYPNPFNSMTRVRYALPEAGKIMISVYDIQGRLVRTLFNGTQEAGYQSLTWDANGVSSGIYIVRLTAGQKSLSQKVLLAR